MSDTGENGRYPKRDRKPKVAFIPDHPDRHKKQQQTRGPKKHRNQAADSKQVNKWKDYKDIIKRTINYLIRDMQTLEVKFEGKTAPARGRNTLWEMERMKVEKKIFTAKQVIVTTLQAIDSENTEDKRWPELLADKNEVEGEEDDGMVDIDNILCSRCNQEETEDNDILFCDRAGCGRAYHQKCLEPALDLTSFVPEEDWFCWQCECLDDCLEIISERLDHDYWDWREVFPEVNQSLQSLANGDTILTADFGDDDEEDEEEYNPSDEENEENNVADDDEDESGDEEEEDGGNPRKQQNLSDDEDEEDDDDDDSFDNNDDDDDEEIDADEVQGLLADANLSYLPDPVEEVPIARRLRERRSKKEAIVIELKGAEDVGRLAARVRRGVFQVGKVMEFIPSVIQSENQEKEEEKEEDKIDLSTSQWKVVFSKRFLNSTSSSSEQDNTSDQRGEESVDGTILSSEAVEEEGETNTSKRRGEAEEIVVFTATQMTEAFTMYEEYQQRLQQSEQQSSKHTAIAELLQTTGKIDLANVIEHKRERKAIDYVSLSLQLFGSLRDEDQDEEEDSRVVEETTSSGRRRKRRTFEEEDHNEDSGGEEIDEEIDQEWDDGDNRKKKSNKRRKGNNRQSSSRKRNKDEESV